MTALGQMATTSPLCGAEARPAVYIMQSRHPTAVGNVPTGHWQGEGRSPPHQRAQLGLRRAHTLGVSRAKGTTLTTNKYGIKIIVKHNLETCKRQSFFSEKHKGKAKW